jgi:outer membrane protein assembly factor BamE (lipoprotein component of BamABCDE complex)
MHRNALLLLSLLLSACLSQEDQNVLRKITPGMDKDSVRGILGVPVNQSRTGGEEMWLFYTTTGSRLPYLGATNTMHMVQVYFKGNVVSRCLAASTDSPLGPLPNPDSNTNNIVDCSDS